MNCTNGSSFNNNFVMWMSIVADVKLLEKGKREEKKNLWTVVGSKFFYYFYCCQNIFLLRTFFILAIYLFLFGQYWKATQWEILLGITACHMENVDDLSDMLCWKKFLIWSFWSSIFIIFLQHYVNNMFSLERVFNILFPSSFEHSNGHHA